MGWHETFLVDLGGGSHARFCAFNTKVSFRGSSADVHKGQLFTSIEDVKVVVKVPRADGLRECQAELAKQEVAAHVLKKFPGEMRDVRLVRKYSADVHVVGLLHKWFCKKPLKVGAPVLIQNRVSAQHLHDFRGLLTTLPEASRAHHPLCQLARLSLALFQGSLVIIPTKGVIVGRAGAADTYRVTSLVVHSRDQRFGRCDEGPAGLDRFLQDSGLGRAVLFCPPHPALRPPAYRETDPRADIATRGVDTDNWENEITARGAENERRADSIFARGAENADNERRADNIFARGAENADNERRADNIFARGAEKARRADSSIMARGGDCAESDAPPSYHSVVRFPWGQSPPYRLVQTAV